MSVKLSTYPELEEAYTVLRTDPVKALAICDRFASNNPENIDLHLARTQAYNRLENWSGMKKSADAYVRLEPSEPMPYWKRAQASYNLAEYDQAISDLHTATSLDEEKFLGSRPYRLLAMSHAKLGNLSNALSCADEGGKFDKEEWFPPVGPIPSGTMAQFKAYLTRTAQNAR